MSWILDIGLLQDTEQVSKIDKGLSVKVQPKFDRPLNKNLLMVKIFAPRTLDFLLRNKYQWNTEFYEFFFYSASKATTPAEFTFDQYTPNS